MYTSKYIIAFFWIIAAIVATISYFDSSHVWRNIGIGAGLFFVTIFIVGFIKSWRADADAALLSKPSETVEDIARKRRAYRRTQT